MAARPYDPRTCEIFTTGQIGRTCGFAPRTVAKWCDSGLLPAYRVPGGEDRRIPRKALLKFLREHQMPTDAFEPNPPPAEQVQ